MVLGTVLWHVAQVGLDHPASDLLALRSEGGAAILMGPQVPREQPSQQLAAQLPTTRQAPVCPGEL